MATVFLLLLPVKDKRHYKLRQQPDEHIYQNSFRTHCGEVTAAEVRKRKDRTENGTHYAQQHAHPNNTEQVLAMVCKRDERTETVP